MLAIEIEIDIYFLDRKDSDLSNIVAIINRFTVYKFQGIYFFVTEITSKANTG